MFIRQNYRIYPNKDQTVVLNQWLGQARFIWNYMLAKNIEKYQLEQKFIFKFDMNNLFASIDLSKVKVDLTTSTDRKTVFIEVIPVQSVTNDTAMEEVFLSNDRYFMEMRVTRAKNPNSIAISFRVNKIRMLVPKINTGFF
jgi:transposase